MGRLTHDLEMRKSGETPVCSFRITCERDYKNKDGEKEADYIDVVVWRQKAEFVEKFFTKGRMAVVSGRLQNRFWKDRDREKHYRTENVADNVYFGNSKPKSSEAEKERNTNPGDCILARPRRALTRTLTMTSSRSEIRVLGGGAKCNLPQYCSLSGALICLHGIRYASGSICPMGHGGAVSYRTGAK